MALISNGLITSLTDLKTALSITNADNDTILTQLANAGMRWMDSFTHRRLASKRHRELISGHGGVSRVVRNPPMTELHAIDIEDGSAITYNTIGTPTTFSTGTSVLSITGTYTGRVRTIFTFEVTAGGTIGSGTVTVSWNNGYGRSGSLSVGSGYTAGTATTLTSGISYAFAAGTLTAGETSTVEIDTEEVRFNDTEIVFTGGIEWAKGFNNILLDITSGYNTTDHPDEMEELRQILYEVIAEFFKHYRSKMGSLNTQRLHFSQSGFEEFVLEHLNPGSLKALSFYKYKGPVYD